MALPQIGLEAVFKDAGFQRGIQQFNDGINKASANAERGASAMSRVGAVASGALTVGIGAAVTAFGALTAVSKIGLDATLQWGEGLDKLGDMFGMSGEKASAFQYLANKVGLSVDEMGMGLNTLTRGLADMKAAQGSGEKTTAKSAGSIQNMKEQLADANTQLERAKKRYAEAKKPTAEMGYAIQDAQKKVARLNADIAEGSKLVPKAVKEATPFEKALKTLGVSAYNAKGKMKTFDEILPQIMDAFKKLPPSINKSDLAMTLFGARGGSKFLDFLSAGSKGLEDAAKKVKQLGLELTTAQVNDIEDFGFALNELKGGLTSIWQAIGIQVLPIARQFVDYLNTNVIPRIAELAQKYAPMLQVALKQVGDVLGYVAEALKGNFSPLYNFIDKVFGREVANNAGNFMLYLQGIATEIGKLATTLQTKGLGAMLKEWASDVWSWLTGKGGAVEQVGTKFGELLDKITKWIKDNGPATWDLIKNWAGNFWNWITDKNSGVLVTIATNMGELATKLEAWASNPDTIVRFQKIGEDLAHDILQGMGNFFSNPTPSGESVLIVLWNTLDRACKSVKSVANFFASIGGALAGGIVGGIVGYFLGPEIGARVTGAMTQFFTAFQKIILGPGGPVFGFGWAMAQAAWDGFIANWNALVKSLPGFNLPTINTNHSHEWNPTSYASGGFVPSTGSAYLHAGEFVLTRSQVMQLAPVLAGANNSRTYNISHTWNGAASSFERREIESTVHAAMAEILGTG